MARSYSRSRSRSATKSSRGRSASRDRSSKSRSKSRSRSRSRSRSVIGHVDGYDPAFKGYRVKVADLNTRISKYELEKEFERYGKIIDLILIRRCPTVCFIVYKYSKDARYAARKLHNLSIWSTRLRAELAKPSGKARLSNWFFSCGESVEARIFVDAKAKRPIRFSIRFSDSSSAEKPV